MKAHYCSICNKSTYDVDYEYLVGFDHLACHLGVWGGDGAMKKIKNMKIKGWEKISGFTYKGYTCVNPIHNATGECYYADVLNLNLPQKPKWHLELLLGCGGITPAYGEHILKLLDGNGLNIKHKIELVDIRTIALFRIRYEEIIDEMLSRQLTASTLISSVTPNSHSINNSGIISTINNNANTFTLNTPTTSINIMDTIKDLYKQIDELKQAQSTPDF
jgi:hypothetical protein